MSFANLRYKSKKWLAYFFVQYFNRSAYRYGYFKNGLFPNDSFGRSKKQSFEGFMGQSYLQYLVDGRNQFSFSLRFGDNPPAWNKVFYNLRIHQKQYLVSLIFV